MIINKLKNETTQKTTYYFVIKKDWLKESKNPNYVKLSLNENFLVTIGDNQQVPLRAIISNVVPTKNTK